MYTYDGWSRLIKIQRDKTAAVRELVVESQFDEMDRVVHQSTPTGESDTFTYDLTPTGMHTTVDHVNGPDTETVTYVHDLSGRVVKVIDPYATEVGHAWDRDLATSSVSRRGAESTATYDAAGNATSTGLADPVTPGVQTGSATATYCGPNDPRPVDVTDAAGVVTRYWWTSGSSPTPCDVGRAVPVRVTQAYGTPAAWDTAYESVDNLLTLAVQAPGTGGDQIAVRYNWNALRQITSTVTYPTGTSGAGQTTFYGYDVAGRLIVERDPVGAETWTIRDAAGRVTSAVGPVAVTRTCGATECAFGSTAPSGPTQLWSYNLDGSLASYTDAAGKVTTYASSYSAGGGRVEVVTAPAHGDAGANPASRTKTVTTSTFDRFDRLASVEAGDPAKPGSTSMVSYTYGPLGRLKTAATAVGGGVPDLVESYGYDADGNQTVAAYGTDPGDTSRQQTRRVYDLRGRLIEEWGPTGDSTAPVSVSGVAPVAVQQQATWTWDDADRLLAETSGHGATKSQTFYRYDEASRLRFVITDRDGDGAVSASPTGGPTDPDDEVVEYTYSAAGRLKSTIESPVDVTAYDWATGDQSRKRTTTFNYDQAGQQTAVVDPLGRTTTQTYTARGELLRRTLPGGYYNQYGYDAAGRVEKVTAPSPTGTGTVDTLTGYDPRGLRMSQTDQHQTGAAAPPATTWSYWDDGLVKSVTNPLGGPAATVSYFYDARGNRTERQSTTQASTTAAPRLVVDTWAYDGADRPTVHKRPGETVGATYTYDPTTGAPVAETSPSGRVDTVTYWNSGFPKSVTSTKPADSFGPAHTYRSCQWWDASGNETHILEDDTTNPNPCTDGAVTTQSWDRSGNQTGYHAPDTPNTPVGQDENFTYTSDLGGRPRTVTYPDGTVHQFLHDKLGRLATSAIMWSGGGGFPIVGYQYDTNGNRTKETVNWGEATRTWTYPANGTPHPTSYVQQVPGGDRTTAMAWLPDGRIGSEATGASARSYSYDAAGQLTARSDTTGPDDSYTYGPRGLRLASTKDATATSYSYNDLAQLVGSDDGNGDNRTYSYDQDGRRTQVANPFVARTTSYDARGKPFEIVTDMAIGDDITETSSHNARGELTTQTVTIGTDPPAEWSFLWDPTRPAATPLEMRLNDTLSARSNYGLEMVGMHFAGNGSADYYAFDIRRSVLPSTSHNSGPSDYDAFGTPNQTMALQYGYRSEVQNYNEIHLRNRNYTPDNGTFTTPDPLDGIPGTPTETNPYHYTDNDPLNKTDPLGLSPSDDGFSIGECASSVTAIPGEWARGIDTLVTNPTQIVRGYRATVRDLEGLARNTGLGVASRPTGEVLGALSTFFPGVRSGSDTIVSALNGNYQAACDSAVRTGVDIATIKIIPKVTKTVGKRLTAPKALPRSGPIPRSLGAASRAEQLAKKLHLNVNSPTARQVLNSLDDSVAEFVGTYRKGSIWRELSGEVAEMSVEEALRYSPAARKLLVDNRFVKR